MFQVYFSCKKATKSLEWKVCWLHLFTVNSQISSLLQAAYWSAERDTCISVSIRDAGPLLAPRPLIAKMTHGLDNLKLNSENLQRQKTDGSNALHLLTSPGKGIQLMAIWAPTCTHTWRMRRTDCSEVSIYYPNKKDKAMVNHRCETVDPLFSAAGSCFSRTN